ncbi:MAG: hypothetical protein E7009_00315 [Alphaproteobacteria bacterium]|nr:hypothetical protein [Alphaproteobacteria bacterium]
MANMKDFLTAYYNRLIFREMSHEQFVQFCGYIKDKKATDNQKIWAEELLKKDPVTGEFETVPGTNIYVKKEIPDPQDPADELYLGADDKEWKKLFKAFQTAFQSMDGAKNSFKYNDKANKFLEKYFGSHTTGTTTVQHLFQYTKATPAARAKIGPAPAGAATVTLHGFLTKYRNRLELQLKNWGVLNDDFSYDDLLSGIASEKYNKNPKFRKQMEHVAQVIDGYIAGDTTMQARLGISNPNDIPDCGDLAQWFDDDNIPTFRLQQFKNEYPILLNTLRKESKVREVFEQYDEGKISGPLNKALANQSYDNPNSDDYVQPKREDTLTIPERLSEWWGDTYSDCLEKYIKLSGDRLYFSPQAKAIAGKLPKDLKKTDGLDGVLKHTGSIRSKLKEARDFESAKHVEWFEKTLTALKNDKKLSKVWAGALKNGTHMQALVKEIMIRAIKEGKVKEAKTALELISVLHYGYTTSKVMDTLAKTDFTVFSDKSLSFNKTDGVKFVTNALDKGIKTAFMGIGYGITIIGNAIKLSGRKINKFSDKNGNFKSEHDQYLQQQQNDKQSLQNLLTSERAQRTNTEATINTITAGRTVAQTQTDLTNDIGNLETIINNFCATEIQTLEQAINQTVYNVNATGTWAPIANNAELTALDAFLNSISGDTLAAMPTLTGTDPSIPALQNHLNTIAAQHANLVTNRGQLANKQQSLDDLINGTELLTQLTAQITEHENEVNNWDANHIDELEELVKYWNMLETGRNTHMGPMYNWLRNLKKKNAQKRFNQEIPNIISAYNQSHTIAA